MGDQQNKVTVNNVIDAELPADGYHFMGCIDKTRFLLAILYMIGLFGFPTSYGRYVSIISNVAVPIALILSGYLVLWETEDRNERIARTIRRTAIAFVSMFVLYLAVNLYLDSANTIAVISGKRFWFDLIVLDSWRLPVGVSIWYVQAILYAYIIIYILDKLNLLRFDWVIMVVCFAVSLIFGELAGAIGFDFLGYDYIGANWFTRALPYILAGGFLHRKEPYFARLEPLHYVTIAALGLGMMFLEMWLFSDLGILVYYGHLFGMAVCAVSVAAVVVITDGGGFVSEFLGITFIRQGTFFMYYICELVYLLICRITNSLPDTFKQFRGLLTILACAVIVAILRYIQIRIGFARRVAAERKFMEQNGK